MAKRRQYGLIGKNIDYSFSKQYFTSKFANSKDTESTYENFDLGSIAEFSQVLEANPRLKGLNVTIPYKQSIIPYLDELSENAISIGAINTIRITKKGKLKGYNTDWFGFYKSIKPLIGKNHTHALILGTGGASKAIHYALNKLDIHCTSVSRNSEEEVIQYDQITEEIFAQNHIIVNTTPLGTFPNTEEKPPLNYSLFTPNHLAFDLIYNPEQTAFLKAAAQAGAQTKNGYEMLINQAEKSWSIWNKIDFTL